MQEEIFPLQTAACPFKLPGNLGKLLNGLLKLCSVINNALFCETGLILKTEISISPLQFQWKLKLP